jgi:hypothetical protein
MSDQEKANELLRAMKERGLDAYGSIIPGDWVREVLGIQVPELGTKRDFDAAAIAELSVVDRVRTALLDQGKYLGMREGDYRILLPSENARQVELYMQQADKKLRRGLRLSRSSPQEASAQQSNVETRMAMKQQSIRRQLRPTN